MRSLNKIRGSNCVFLSPRNLRPTGTPPLHHSLAISENEGARLQYKAEITHAFSHPSRKPTVF